MASSAVSICSNALQQLGDDPISSFNISEGKRARTAGNLWPQVRDALLRAHTWPCARKRVILAPEATAPAFDWQRSFLLPADWMRTLQVGRCGERLDFEHEGRRLLANVSSLPLVYTWRNEDPAQWDSYLCDLACTLMVARLAYPVTQSASLAELKAAEAKEAMRMARAIAGQDNDAEDWGDAPFTDVRF